jgi:hypothetical protein
VPYAGTLCPAVANTKLAASNNIAIFSTPVNVTGLIGTVLYAGYGADMTALLNNGTYAAIYAFH